MSKQQLQAAKTIFKIEAANPTATNFFKYLAHKYKVNQSDAKKLAADEDKILEFFFRISFVKKIHSVPDDITASNIVSNPSVMAQGMRHELYKDYNFMHYMAVNSIPANIFEQYVTSWVAAGLSLSLKDEKGQTPLDYALIKNRIDCVKKLSDGGVDLTELDYYGFSPLHKLTVQVRDGDSLPESIKLWCDLKLPTGTVSARGWSPLEFAVGQGNISAVMAFVESGIGTGQGSLDNNSTVLHYCVKHGQIDIITKLIGKCDFNMKDSGNGPAIAQALVLAKEDIVKILVKGGSDLTLMDQFSGKTILHLLLEANMLPQAAVAAQIGCNVNFKDFAGNSPMDLLIKAITNGSYTNFDVNSAAIEIFCTIGKGIVELKHLESISMSNIDCKDRIFMELNSYFTKDEKVSAEVKFSEEIPLVTEKVEIPFEVPTDAVLDLFAQLGIVPIQAEGVDEINVVGKIHHANTELDQ